MLTTPYLRSNPVGAEWVSWPQPDVDSDQVLRNLKEHYERGAAVVVFDTGVNDADPQALADNLRKAAAQVGDTCMVLSTVDAASDGSSNDVKSRATFEFAASRPGTQVLEWSGVVDMTPRLRLYPKGFRPNHPAATYRARMMAEAVRDCLAYRLHRRPPPETTDGKLFTPGDRISKEVQRLGRSS